MTLLHLHANEIIRVTVGSTLHGVVTGSDDTDEMGVFIPDATRVLGLDEDDHEIHRTAWERTGTTAWSRRQPRSEAGDTDLALYSLRKYSRLAVAGNPSVLLLLFVPDLLVLHRTPAGLRLQQAAPSFVSRAAGERFLGFLRAQREGVVATKGGRSVKRPELVERYGYDTKFAYHALRLGIQGIELMETGRITLPLPADRIAELDAVRGGEVPEAEVLQRIAALEAALREACEYSPLPRSADRDAVNAFLVDEHLRSFGDK